MCNMVKDVADAVLHILGSRPAFAASTVKMRGLECYYYYGVSVSTTSVELCVALHSSRKVIRIVLIIKVHLTKHFPFVFGYIFYLSRIC